MFPGLVLYCTDLAQHLVTAGYDLGDLDDVDDLKQIVIYLMCLMCAKFITNPIVQHEWDTIPARSSVTLQWLMQWVMR